MGKFEYTNLLHFPGGHTKDDEANQLITKIVNLDNDIYTIKCAYNPRSIAYELYIYFKNHIPLRLCVAREAMGMNAELLQQITDRIREHKKPPKDPEWISENENEQAMLDAGRDYGFI